MQMDYSCGFLIKQIHDKLEKQSNNTLRSEGLTMAQITVLLELDQRDPKQLSLKELERLLHVAQSTTAGIVSRLEQKGLVECLIHPDDRRVKMVRITSSGKSCCLLAEQHMKQAEEHLLQGLSESERAVFASLLRKVRDTQK